MDSLRTSGATYDVWPGSKPRRQMVRAPVHLCTVARRSSAKRDSRPQSHKKTGTPKASSAIVRRRMRATRQRDTPGEMALRTALWSLGLRYRVDVTLPGTRRRADVAFVRARVAVFVDGCFWHGCPEHGTWPKANAIWWRTKIEANRRRDLDTDLRLRSAGWTVLRFWEHTDPMAAARRVADALKG
jgi:DNA mismatch endonuclease (patch repair protein)